MAHVDLLRSLPKVTRNIEKRAAAKDPALIATAKEFGQMYWDGPREYGYGGYRYDSRWRSVAKDIIAHFDLKPGDRVLDVGCGKGFPLKCLASIFRAMPSSMRHRNSLAACILARRMIFPSLMAHSPACFRLTPFTTCRGHAVFLRLKKFNASAMAVLLCRSMHTSRLSRKSFSKAGSLPRSSMITPKAGTASSLRRIILAIGIGPLSVKAPKALVRKGKN